MTTQLSTAATKGWRTASEPASQAEALGYGHGSVGIWAWRHPRRQTQSPFGEGVAPKLCQVTRGSKSLVAPGLEKVETPSASGQQSNPSPLKTAQADGGLDKRNP